MAIEKKIHYCWFGRNEKSELIEKCIRSWEVMLPDYEIIEWNEENFDVYLNDYTREAYKLKKYAFVSDFARFYILYNHGGIYLDVDVEILKSLDPFLDHVGFTGFESIRDVNPGLIIGVEKKNKMIKEILDTYYKRRFKYSEKVINQTTVVEVTTRMLSNYGLQRNNKKQNIRDITIYPRTYFSPYAYGNLESDFTDSTYSIHHFAGSWISESDKQKNLSNKYEIKKKFLTYIKYNFVDLFSEDNFYKIKKMVKG